MWTMVQYLGQLEEFRRDSRVRRREILYIEEPEAHLFPKAQSAFLSYLFDTLSFKRGGRSLILTTHSPYIMGRLNVFLKAGAISRRKKNNTALNEIIPRERWLLPSDFAAYAIDNGKCRSIVGNDGIVDSSFLDAISEDIIHDFDRLLQLEASFT
jgi:predicted ATP-dependent endonuclease of OLD family